MDKQEKKSLQVLGAIGAGVLFGALVVSAYARSRRFSATPDLKPRQTPGQPSNRGPESLAASASLPRIFPPVPPGTFDPTRAWWDMAARNQAAIRRQFR